MRCPGVTSTSSQMRLALGRGHGPAVRARWPTVKGPSSFTCSAVGLTGALRPSPRPVATQSLSHGSLGTLREQRLSYLFLMAEPNAGEKYLSGAPARRVKERSERRPATGRRRTLAAVTDLLLAELSSTC